MFRRGLRIKTVNFIVKLIPLILIMPTNTQAGAYVFAGESLGVELVTHPEKYIGNGGDLTIRICIDPASFDANAMEIPLQNNIKIYNELQPTTGNLSLNGNNNIPSGAIDFESVSLHEVGHCLGMDHPNLATESLLPKSSYNYTKTTDGMNDQYDVGPGVDGIIGSSDDIRGDDANLHWFRISNNNPFTIASTVDSSTYSRNLNDLPVGHLYAANADRNVGTLLGVSNTESVMQQGTFVDEAQRTLGHDDVETLLYAASGVDEVYGNADDYTIILEYGGISSINCDLSLSMIDDPDLLAACAIPNGAYVAGNTGHARLDSPYILFGDSYNWFFNTQQIGDTDGDGLLDTEEATLGTDPINIDTDGDGLIDGSDGFIAIANYPGGIDSDGDGFVDGEQDFATDPLLDDTDGDGLTDGIEVANGSDPLDDLSWPAFADGDLGPYGSPDGIINAADSLIAFRIVLTQLAVTPLQLAHGDVYPVGAPDGEIDMSDLILIQQMVFSAP